MSQPKVKLLYINNLRIVLITLIIMLHLAITYGAAGSWYYKEPGADTVSSVLLTLFTGAVQAFALGFFFLISGYFTPGSYNRKGAAAYLKDRLIRLGLPLLIYYFILSPLIVYVLYVKLKGDTVPWPDFFGTGPLWFVEVLLIFGLGYYLWRQINHTSSRAWPTPGSLDILKFVVALALVNFMVRIGWPAGQAVSNLQLGYFPGYIGFFIAGIIAYHNQWFDHFQDAMGRRWLIVAAVTIPLLPAAIFVSGLDKGADLFMGGFTWQSLVYSAWEAVIGAGLVAGLFVIFRQRFNTQTRLTEIMAANAYGVYIIHAPVIIFFAYAVRGLSIYPLLKFFLAAIIGVSLCFAISYVVRRIPYVDKVL
jgi:glucans biosynthesis protein C